MEAHMNHFKKIISNANDLSDNIEPNYDVFKKKHVELIRQ